MILGKGHDTAVDLWALGVLLFELSCGFGPFASPDDDSPPIDIYKRILDGHISFPPHFSRSLQDIIKKLLEPAAFKRLGNSSTGTEGLKSHRWFAGYPWEDLNSRKLSAPILPIVTSKVDSSNFDEIYDVSLDELPPISDWHSDDF